MKIIKNLLQRRKAAIEARKKKELQVQRMFAINGPTVFAGNRTKQVLRRSSTKIEVRINSRLSF